MFSQVKAMPLEKCSKDLYKKLYSLNQRRRGEMRSMMVSVYAHNKHVAYITDRDGNIAGWALIFENYETDSQQLRTHLYTRQKYRRRGLGTKILQGALNYVDKYIPGKVLYYTPWDDRSGGFFESVRGRNALNERNSYYHWV